MSNPNIDISNLDSRYSKPADVAAAISTQAASDSAQYAPKSSPTFTGTVTLPATTPTTATQAVTKGYVDTQISAVSNQGIPDGSVTSAKIADGTIVAADISASAAIAASQLDSATQTTLSTVSTNTSAIAGNTTNISKLTLVPTATKTNAYAAVAQDLVLADAGTVGSFTVTLPMAPSDGTLVAVKKMDVSTNAVTVAAGTNDSFNSGGTSLTLVLQGQAVTLRYQSGAKVWIGLSNNITLNSLDTRYITPGAVDAKVAAQAATDASTYAPQNNPTFTGTMSINGALALKRTTVSDSNYSVLATDNIIEYTSLSVARTITLPTAIGISGKIYTVKDTSNNANTYNITIATTNSQTIDGAATQTISKNYGEMVLYSDGANWRIQSRDNYYGAATTELGTLLNGAGLRPSAASYSINTSGTITTTGAITSNGNNVVGYNMIATNSMTANVGLVANGTTYLKQNVIVFNTTITSNTTLTTTSTQYQYVNSASAVTVTLPSSTTISGLLFTVKNISTGTVTIAGTIDGATNYTLAAQYKYVTVMATATSGVWYVVGNN